MKTNGIRAKVFDYRRCAQDDTCGSCTPKTGQAAFQADTLRSGAGGNWVSEEFSPDSLNRSCLCRHTGLGETCAGEVFQPGILVSLRRLTPEQLVCAFRGTSCQVMCKVLSLGLCKVGAWWLFFFSSPPCSLFSAKQAKPTLIQCSLKYLLFLLQSAVGQQQVMLRNNKGLAIGLQCDFCAKNLVTWENTYM